MRLILLEDQYAPKIYQELQYLSKNFIIPIKWNIKTPLDFFKIIDSISGEYIILLDNYFPGRGYEEPLGDVFLQKLLKTGKDYKIICISDRGKRLLEDYKGWKHADKKRWIIGWCTNKNGKEIFEKIKKYV